MRKRLTRRGFLQSTILAPAALGLSTNLQPALAAEPIVRKITPPDLNSAHLGRRILCHRPMRRGAPNLSVQTTKSKIIAHNYGHGGSGWTLAPGSATYVVNLVEEAAANREKIKAEPVIVIGAGVMGLFTAYELMQRGYRDITIIAERFENLTSHNAGGLLAPVSMDNDPKMQAIIDKIGVDAYRFYASIANGKNDQFKGGAIMIPAYFEKRSESGLEPYVGVVMNPAKDVVLDFGNGTRRPMVSYDDGIFMNTAVLMDSLTKTLESRVVFKKQKVKSIAGLPANLIFDCTGLGAAELNGDHEMVSVQGHLIMLKDQKPEDMQYMILVYFGEGKTESGQKVKRSFYQFPKHLPNTGKNDVGVIGGTFIEAADAKTPNVKEFDRVVRGAKRFYGLDVA